MKETRTFTVNAKVYTYTFERKQIKNLILRIKSDGTLHVSAPTRMAMARIENYLAQQTNAIERALTRFAAKREAAPKPLLLQTGESLPLWGISHTICVERGAKRTAYAAGGVLTLTVKDPDDAAERYQCFTEFLDREARVLLTARTATLLPLFAPKPAQVPTLTFRTMTSKWGVCRPSRGCITFNRALLYVPSELADYVICHELAHFHHADHSAAFWQTLAAIMPDCKERRKALNAFPIPTFQASKKS